MAEKSVRVLPTSNVLPGKQTALPRNFLMVGHRGNTDDAPESTLPAFAKAIERGDDGIEFDVRWTSDGHAVVMHDDLVDRTTNGHGYVTDLTESQIERLDAGSWFSPLYLGTRVPTAAAALQEIVQRSSTVSAFVHVKVMPTSEQAAALVRAASVLGDRATFMVEHDNVAAVLRAAGATRFGLMVHRPAQWNATGYQVFVPYSAVDPNLVTAERIAAARARGIAVIPVLGYPMTLERAIADDADGVYTDADIDCARPFGLSMCHAAVPAPERR
ncbi:MAG TPA: glycerophosphodiester phosphodiesterase family protein [Sporichthyaceae bacterium]|jgi:glycerophosphoryl diester phosphodiesterase